jgi:hypothetical protein
LDDQRHFHSQSAYYQQDGYKQHHLSQAANTQTDYLNPHQGNPNIQNNYHPNQPSYQANQQPYQY